MHQDDLIAEVYPLVTAGSQDLVSSGRQVIIGQARQSWSQWWNVIQKYRSMPLCVQHERLLATVKSLTDYWVITPRGTSLKSVVWILVLIKQLYNNVKGMHLRDITEKLTVDELQSAEVATLKYVQRQAFSEEIVALRIEHTVSKSSSIYRLSPMLIAAR